MGYKERGAGCCCAMWGSAVDGVEDAELAGWYAARRDTRGQRRGGRGIAGEAGRAAIILDIQTPARRPTSFRCAMPSIGSCCPGVAGQPAAGACMWMW